MRSFLRSIPDFQILTSSEQSSLLERNLQGISGLTFTLVSRDTCVIDHSPSLTEAIRFYGFEVVCRAQQLKNRLDPDSTLVKLMLPVLAFSSNCVILDVPRTGHHDSLLLGTFRLLGSQNVFVEILWRYLVYRYGDLEAVKRFSGLVKQMLDEIDHVAKIYKSNKVHQQFLDQTFHEFKLSSSNRMAVCVPLWGNG